jgi:HK97 gp10 family phage protein
MKFKNFNRFKKKLNDRLVVNPRGNAIEAVERGTSIVRNTAIESITAGGTGKTYQKYNPRRTHTASAANRPPASDTGFLVSQISTSVKPRADGSVVGQIISAAPYSKPLEFGTVNMQPRPFMQPALNRNARKIKQIFKEEGIITK